MTIHHQPQHIVGASSLLTTLGLDDPRLPHKAIKVDCRWLGVEWSVTVPYSGNPDSLRREVLRRAPAEIGRKAACHPEHLRATVTVKVADLYVPYVPSPAPAPTPQSLPASAPAPVQPAIAQPENIRAWVTPVSKKQAEENFPLLMARQAAAAAMAPSVTPLPYRSAPKGGRRQNSIATISQAKYNEMMIGAPIRADADWHRKRASEIDKDAYFINQARIGLFELLAEYDELFVEAHFPSSGLSLDEIEAVRDRIFARLTSLESTHETWLYGTCDDTLRRVVQFNQQVCISKQKARCRADAVAIEEFLVELEATGSMLTISTGLYPAERFAEVRRRLTRIFQRVKKNLRKSERFQKLGVDLDFVLCAHEVTVKKAGELQVIPGLPLCQNGHSECGLYVHPHIHMIALHEYIDPAKYRIVQEMVQRTFERVAKNNGLRLKTVNWKWMRRSGRDGAKKVVAELVKYALKGSKLHLVDNDLTPRQCAVLFDQTFAARMRIFSGSLAKWRRENNLTPKIEMMGRYWTPEALRDPNADDPSPYTPMLFRTPAARIRRCGEERVIVRQSTRLMVPEKRYVEWVDGSWRYPKPHWVLRSPEKPKYDFSEFEDDEDDDEDDGYDGPNIRPSSVCGISGITAMPGERLQRHLVMRSRKLTENEARMDAQRALMEIVARVNQDRYVYNKRAGLTDVQVDYLDSLGKPWAGSLPSSKGGFAGTGIPFQRDPEIALEEEMEDVLAEGSQSRGILQTQVVTLLPASHPPRPLKPPRSGKRGPPQGAQAPCGGPL